MYSNTFIAALCPGIPLTAPPRFAEESDRKIFGNAVSNIFRCPGYPDCASRTEGGAVGAELVREVIYGPWTKHTPIPDPASGM